MRISPGRGGNFHPLDPRAWVMDHLREVGEDYIASMHRAYKEALDRLAVANGRRFAYHKPRYKSFHYVVQQLHREGMIEFTREEEADSPQFVDWPEKPLRRYYQLIQE